MESVVSVDRRYRQLTWLFVGLIAAGCVVGIIVPAGLGWDFGNFYDAGHRVAAGQIDDLYDAESLIEGNSPQGTMKFWGTPISAVLYAPLSWLPPEEALVLFKIQNVLALAAGQIIAFLFYRRFVPPSAQSRFGALFAFLCLIYQPFWTVFRVGGQTTPTVFLLLTSGLILHTLGRSWGSALCVVVATLIKPVLAPALIFLLCISGVAYLRKAAVLLAVVGTVSLMWMGWPVHMSFLTRILGEVQDIRPWAYNSSLYVVIGTLRTAVGAPATSGFSTLLFSGLTYGLKALVLGTTAYLAVKSRRQRWPDPARRHFDFLMALLFFLLWSSTLWEHYLAVLFLPLVYIVASSQHFPRRALALVAAIFALSVGQNLILIEFLRARFTLDSFAELVGIGLFKSGPLLLTLILLWRHHPDLFRSHAAPSWQRPQVTPPAVIAEERR